MELRHLRYFIAVAEERHITRAAERLGMQQPPLSQQIKLLEAQLGFALFRRLPRGVELTEAGRMFLRDAKALLSDLDAAAERAARAAQGMEGAVAIGFTTSAAAHSYAPGLLRAFRSACPRVALQLKEDNAGRLTEALVEGKLDVALLRAPVTRPAGLAFHTILQEPLLLALPADHRLAASPKAVSLRLLQAEEFILVRQPGASGMYSDLLAACGQLGFVPRIAAEVGRMLTNISMVAAGLGVSIVPASMRGFHPDRVAYRELCDAPGLVAPMSLVYREENTNRAAENFIALVRETPPETLQSASAAP
ncbi:LysR family transcriptional regulator [Noviherbaspirillum pedocola]|uniref:LysR family transcriptional regulator n=1 Tax=Noviherbaspirillum pedocola TaxID=2801341 RepID=A0A934W8R3_9BURK|nr:LysR family transcriptional regulator [Noviherbaspirillum pedocola]MBK4738957.1 LysR family transcriptional regulator [Noviherbaspirillum pedocola]